MEGENGSVSASKPLHPLCLKGPPSTRFNKQVSAVSGYPKVCNLSADTLFQLCGSPNPSATAILPTSWLGYVACCPTVMPHCPSISHPRGARATTKAPAGWPVSTRPFVAQPCLTHRTVRDPYSTLPPSLPPRREQSYQMSESSHIP